MINADLIAAFWYFPPKTVIKMVTVDLCFFVLFFCGGGVFVLFFFLVVFHTFEVVICRFGLIISETCCIVTSLSHTHFFQKCPVFILSL